jgi:hypothetical protein
VKRFTAVVVALLCFIGCAPPLVPFHYVNVGVGPSVPLKVIPVWIDDNFGQADQVSIDDSVQRWNYALNGFIKLEVRSTHFNMEPEVISQVMQGGGWLILRIDSKSAFVHDHANSLTLAFANALGGNRIYVIRDRVENSWVTGLMLHEMGHLLGAAHDGHDLMAPTYNWEACRCIDYEALQEVAQYQHLPLQQLNYCVRGDN